MLGATVWFQEQGWLWRTLGDRRNLSSLGMEKPGENGFSNPNGESGESEICVKAEEWEAGTKRREC